MGIYTVKTREAKKAYKRRCKNQYLVRALKSVPCTDCGVLYPYYVMEFDHIIGTKSNSISGLMSGTKGKLLLEISKCELVCANCHRIRTYKHLQK